MNLEDVIFWLVAVRCSDFLCCHHLIRQWAQIELSGDIPHSPPFYRGSSEQSENRLVFTCPFMTLPHLRVHYFIEDHPGKVRTSWCFHSFQLPYPRVHHFIDDLWIEV